MAADRPTGSDRAGPYELLEPIGKGGIGEVWRARHTALGRTVALKLLSVADPDSLARFKREAKIVARLNHPHIAQLFEVGEDPARPFIAMQLIDGGPIDRAPLPMRGKIAALRDAARAVHFAHTQGILHRDLKPANILVDEQGRGVVLDFGLAREVERTDSTLSHTGDVFGTPAYMAPEQAMGDLKAIDAHTDVWGLGATLFALVAGRPPFDGRTAFDVVRRVIHEDPPSLGAAADPDLDTIVQKAMEKDRARRYPTAAAFADELDRFLAGDPIQARPASVIYKLKKRIRRRPAVWGLSAALVLGFLAWIASWIHDERGRRIAGEAEAARLQRRQDAQPHYYQGARMLDALDDLVYSRVPIGERRAALIADIEAAASRALERDGTFAEAYALRAAAQLSYAPGDPVVFASVEADLTEAIRLAPAYLTARIDRGRLYMLRFVEEVMWDNLTVGDPTESGARHEAWRRRAMEDFEAAMALGGEEEELLVCTILVPVVEMRFGDAYKTAREAIPKLHRRREAEILQVTAQMFMALVLRLPTDGARLRLDEILDQWPRDRYARLLRAYLLHSAREHAGAYEDFSVVAEDEPRDGLAQAGRAETLRRLDRPEEALPILESLVEKRPALWQAWMRLGHTRSGLRDLDGAIEAFGRAADAAPPGTSAPFLSRGNAYRQSGDPERAAADYRRVIEIGGGNEFAPFYFLGLALKDAGRPREALDAFDRAVELAPDNAAVRRHRGEARLAAGEWAGAEEDFDHEVKRAPGEPIPYVNRGEARLRQGNREAALEDFERAHEMGLHSARLHALLKEAKLP